MRFMETHDLIILGVVDLPSRDRLEQIDDTEGNDADGDELLPVHVPDETAMVKLSR